MQDFFDQQQHILTPSQLHQLVPGGSAPVGQNELLVTVDSELGLLWDDMNFSLGCTKSTFLAIWENGDLRKT